MYSCPLPITAGNPTYPGIQCGRAPGDVTVGLGDRLQPVPVISLLVNAYNYPGVPAGTATCSGQRLTGPGIRGGQSRDAGTQPACSAIVPSWIVCVYMGGSGEKCPEGQITGPCHL